MGKNPSVIFKQLYKQAKNKEATLSKDGLTGLDLIIHQMNAKDECFYVPYTEVIREFLIEGYSEARAKKHITQWINHDLLVTNTYGRYKLIGIYGVS